MTCFYCQISSSGIHFTVIMINKNFFNPAAASLLLRVGLAFTYIYASIDAFRKPDLWLSFLPEFMLKLAPFPDITVLHLLSVVQLVIAAFLIFKILLPYTAIVSALFLTGIIVTDLDAFLITFRDVPLVLASIAIILLDPPVVKTVKTKPKKT